MKTFMLYVDYNFICICLGKFYLVDVGYPNVPRFLALYWCMRYHLKEFCRENPISIPQELFNHRHSSLRNVIECTFGIFKKCFPILKHVTSYNIINQINYFLSCGILHNFIMMEDGIPSEVEIEEDDDDHVEINVPVLETYGMNQQDRDEWGKFQDEIAQRMWEHYNS